MCIRDSRRLFFFFQAEDGIRDAQESRGLGDVYKRQYQRRVHGELQEEIEKGLFLIAATAIEDKLQDKVGETISMLMKTGIKIWVLTGDKIETAINIGYSCKLLSDELENFIIDGKTIEDVRASLAKAKEALQKAKTNNKQCAMTISGDALIHAMKNNDDSSMIVEIGNQCKAVVACRVSPKQKQEIVSLVRHHKPEANTLAIGDGANDVNMIIAAHVGIGIKGVEGQQAARASDYSFGEFKHLQRLLLYHGRESYRRNTHLILYNFFKNMILVLPQFWYGTLNGFSAVMIYEPFIFQLFNIFFASLPIVIYAVFDEELPDKTLVENPSYYKQGMKDVLFNQKRYWGWVLYGFLQASAICFFCFNATEFNFSHKSGFTESYWLSGIFAFGAVIIISNFKILLFSNSHTIVSLVVNFGSSLLFVLFFLIFSQLEFSELFGLFSILHSMPNYFIGLIVLIGITTLIDMAVTRWLYYIDEEQEAKELEQDRGKSISLAVKSAPFEKKYTGFAWSIEEPVSPEMMKAQN
eukprot:TRINITY_DN387_c0_g1_i14.p1 TRINITY_DN387_c0_g1~~TRINITY_DN387_c0_g1_i14.p1  ORF type:complete len:525 (+),score=144.03 TRINITY_DN387_c0_g1_i14:3-1577(+)